MSPRVQLWELDGTGLTEIRPQRLDLESRLEEWIERDISLLGEKLLTIGRQAPTAFGGRIDLSMPRSRGLEDPRSLLDQTTEIKRERSPACRVIWNQIILVRRTEGYGSKVALPG